MNLQIDLVIDDAGWDTVPELHPIVDRAVREAHASSGLVLADDAELSVLLCDDAAIRELNGRWRGQDKATNVLSFPAASSMPLTARPLLGDIAIARETTQREAEQDDKTLPDHLTHLVVHGFLHLVGYDHETAEEAEKMESLETRILARLGIADPYAGTEPLSREAR